MKKSYLYITVFFSGMTALAVELSASRLIGNVYGSSNLVWASVIGLILIYLTMGYWLGGKIADKHPNYQKFYSILMWSSLMVGLVPILTRPLLRWSSLAFDQLKMGILAGSFVTILVLFIIPVTLIGMISPFALKLSIKDTATAGKTAGRLSAISTLGSFIGTFLPVLVLIPLIGTYHTFLVFSTLLMLIATAGYWLFVGIKPWLRYAWMPVLLLALWIFGAVGPDKASENLIYETESSYNYIQVIEDHSYRFLRLNEGQGMHSVYHPTELNYHGPWSQVLVAPFFTSPDYDMTSFDQLAIVGLAAGTTVRQVNAVFDDVQIDGFEIDPKIVDVGRTFFDMNQPNLTVHIEDGRWGLSQSDHKYDVISIDAYRPPYIPWHMTTIEFFQIVYDHLAADGVMVINIGRSPLDRALVNDLGTTIRQIFPTIFATDLPGSFNTIVYATKQPGSWDNVLQNFATLQDGSTPSLLSEAMATAITNRQPTPTLTQVYTDDRTPIEWVTNKIVVDFILSGEASDLQ